MKKFSFLILLSVLFSIIVASAKSDENVIDRIIDKIERKYNDIRTHAPFIKANGKPVAKSIRFIQPEDEVIDDYSKLRQIALVRHGEPDMIKHGKFNSFEAQQFLKCYDSVCIIVPEQPFFNIHDKEEVKVFSSPINRALTTAQYLCGPDKEITISPEFREFETKIHHNSKRRLPIKFWTTTARLKWMLGGNTDDIESFSDARKRAKKAAKILDNASEENAKVLLTSHGFLNRYIKKNLKKMGWRVVEDTGNDYFGTTILVKIEE